jgi:pimeloyl-ACP methyl ester carboxylesterase
VRASAAAPVHLLGHSWGGLVAALYAAAHPGAVASLVLVDAIPATSDQLASAWARMQARVRDFQARGLVPGDLPTDLATDLATDVAIDPASAAGDGGGLLLALLPVYFLDPRHPSARTLAGSRFSQEVNRACAGALSRYDLRADVARVRAPALHVLAPVPFGVEMGAALADAMAASPGRRVALSDAGHLPWLERPGPFLACVDDFLTSIERNHPRNHHKGDPS